jgi:hypothetical protein
VLQRAMINQTKVINGENKRIAVHNRFFFSFSYAPLPAFQAKQSCAYPLANHNCRLPGVWMNLPFQGHLGVLHFILRQLHTVPVKSQDKLIKTT